MKVILKQLTVTLLMIAILVSSCIISFAAETNVAINTTTNTFYNNLTEALNNASSGDKILLKNDVYAKVIVVFDNVELDLNGHNLEVEYLACFGDIVDKNETEKGLLTVTENHFILTKTNSQLPIKDGDGYRFFEISKFNAGYFKDRNIFAFQPFISAKGHDLIKKGTALSGISFNVRVTWDTADTTRSQDFIYKNDLVTTFLNSYVKVNDTEKYTKNLILSIANVDKYENLKFEAVVHSSTGVEIVSSSFGTTDDDNEEEQEEQDRIEAEKEQARKDAELKEKLGGKGISILGDSISTFQNWSNNTSYNSTIGGNAVYYTGSRDGFSAVNETWWMQTITRGGLELVVNNSWSGDRVVDRGINRALQLHNNQNKNPDIIAVYLGINDFRTNVTEATFEEKYDQMIAGLLNKYQAADVYLFTLLYTTNVNSGVNPADVVKFNAIIEKTAKKYDCTLVDIYNGTGITSENLASYMGDKNLHPNYAGMDLITQCFIDKLYESYVTPKIIDVSYAGEEKYDLVTDGSEPTLKLNVTYSDNKTVEVEITSDMYVIDDTYVKPNFQNEGTYNAKVNYNGFTVTFTVKVIDPNILIRSEEFTYGSYFDHDRFAGNTGTRLTTGDYIKIRSADALLPAQEITIKVTNTDTTNYKVTLGFYNKDGIYTGRTGIIAMTDGELTIKASEMRGYFRVNVYIYNGRFTKVPEDAQIVVYSKAPIKPVEPSEPIEPDTPTDPDTPTVPDTPADPTPSDRPWEDKKISIVGDSISTGSYPGILANMTGANIQNLAVSGTRLAGGMTSNVSGVATDSDLVIIFGGTNDYWHKVTNIGAADSTDANTFNGALRYILNYLKTNNPNAKYLFVFPPNQTFSGNSSTTDFGKGTLDDFRTAFLNFCTENNLDYVNLAETEFDSSIHSGDGVHPNSTGHQIIAEAIYNKIMTM